MQRFNGCGMENDESIVKSSLTENKMTEMVISTVNPPDFGNCTVKKDMAEALLAQGISEEAVCRILHIDSKQLPDKL